MEAYNRFHKCIFEWERSLLRFIGNDIFADDPKLTINTFIIYGSILVFLFMQLYTSIYYDAFAKVFCLHCFLMSIQASVKLMNLRNVEEMKWLMYFLQNLYETHIKTTSPARIETFGKFAMFTEILFKVLAFVYASSRATFLLNPIVVYLTENELMPIVPLFIPHIDEETVFGYVCVSLYQIYMLSLSVTGLLVCDYFYGVVIITPLIFVNLISFDLEQLHLDLNEKDLGLVVKARFRNILQMHLEINEYMQRVENLTFIVFFVQVSASFVGAVVILHVILTLHFMPALGLLFGLFVEIWIACILGQCFEITSSRIYDSALALKWNQLPLNEQRLYKYFLHQCQNPTLLTVGGFAPLNMDTCVKIFSKIYSIAMVIITMTNE